MRSQSVSHNWTTFTFIKCTKNFFGNSFLLTYSLAAQMVESACNTRNQGSIPGLGRSPGDGNKSPKIFPGGASGEELPANAGDSEDAGSIPRSWRSLVGKVPWSRKWQPIPVFLPGKFHGWRTLVGYSPWGCKESHVTEHKQWLVMLNIFSCVGWPCICLL